jgi:hypothetical protein
MVTIAQISHDQDGPRGDRFSVSFREVVVDNRCHPCLQEALDDDAANVTCPPRYQNLHLPIFLIPV